MSNLMITKSNYIYAITTLFCNCEVVKIYKTSYNSKTIIKCYLSNFKHTKKFNFKTKMGVMGQISIVSKLMPRRVAKSVRQTITCVYINMQNSIIQPKKIRNR